MSAQSLLPQRWHPTVESTTPNAHMHPGHMTCNIFSTQSHPTLPKQLPGSCSEAPPPTPCTPPAHVTIYETSAYYGSRWKAPAICPATHPAILVTILLICVQA